MKMSICAVTDDGSSFELEVEGQLRCSMRVRPVAAADAPIAHSGQPNAAAIAEAEAVFAHLLPENGG